MSRGKFHPMLSLRASKRPHEGNLLPAGKGGHQGHASKHKHLSEQRRSFEDYMRHQEDALFSKADDGDDDDLPIKGKRDKLESTKGRK